MRRSTRRQLPAIFAAGFITAACSLAISAIAWAAVFPSGAVARVVIAVLQSSPFAI